MLAYLPTAMESPQEFRSKTVSPGVQSSTQLTHCGHPQVIALARYAMRVIFEIPRLVYCRDAVVETRGINNHSVEATGKKWIGAGMDTAINGVPTNSDGVTTND